MFQLPGGVCKDNPVMSSVAQGTVLGRSSPTDYATN